MCIFLVHIFFSIDHSAPGTIGLDCKKGILLKNVLIRSHKDCNKDNETSSLECNISDIDFLKNWHKIY